MCQKKVMASVDTSWLTEPLGTVVPGIDHSSVHAEGQGEIHAMTGLEMRPVSGQGGLKMMPVRLHFDRRWRQNDATPAAF